MAKLDPAYEAGEKNLLSRGDVEEFIQKLEKNVRSDLSARSKWTDMQRDNYQRRYALMGRDTEFPWPGSSGIVIPMSDMTIDRLKAVMIGLVTQANPTVSFMPVQPEQWERAMTAQHFFDWLLKNKIPNFVENVAIAIDDILQKGFCILKTTYVYETELVHHVIHKNELPGRLRRFSVIKGSPQDADRMFSQSMRQQAPITKQEFDKLRDQIEEIVKLEWGLDDEDKDDKKAISDVMSFLRSGDEKVMVKFREVKKDYPCVTAIDPMDVVVPDYTRSLDEATRITHRMWYTKDGLAKKKRDSKWNSEGIEMLLDEKQKGKAPSTFYASLDNLTQEQVVREGLLGSPTEDLIEIYETCCLYDIDGDGVGERVVLTWAPETKTPLKFIALPYDHGQWPYTQIGFELNDGRFYSPRGIPEKIKDLEEEITQQHRAKLNRMTIANAPTFKYRKGSGFNPSRVRWIPGDFYGVGRMDDFDVVQVPNLDVSFDREESILRATIESYVGTSDFAISSPLAKPSEPRTATEINLVQDVSQRAIGYRSMLFQLGMKRVYGQVWDLWLQYGPDEVYVRVESEEPIKVTRRELQGDFDLVPVGTVGNTSPTAEAQKALQMFQVLAQTAPMVAQDPRYEVNLGEALITFFQKFDGLNARRFIRRRSPEEMQMMQRQMAAQGNAMAAARNEPVPLDSLVKMSEQAAESAPFGGNQQIKL